MTLTYCISMILAPIQVVIGDERWIVTRLWNRREGGWEMWWFYWEQMADTWMASPFCSTSLPPGFFCNFLTIGYFSLWFFFLNYYYINFTSLYNLFAEHFILLHKTTNLLIISKIQYSFLNFSNYIFGYFLFHQAFYQFWFLFKYFFVLSASLKAVSSHVVSQLYAFRARSTQGDSLCVPVSD